MKRCGVLALGNLLMGDDALGPFVLALLRARYEFPDTVRLLDLGTPGLALSTHLTAWDRLILVDALRGRAPGRLVVLRGNAALAGLSRVRSGAHEPGVDHAVLISQLQEGACPELVLIGAVAQRVEIGAPLSAPVRAAAERVAAAVVRQLGRWGITAREREDHAPPDIWWDTA